MEMTKFSRHNGRDVSMLNDTERDELWTDYKNAPVPNLTSFGYGDLLWAPCLCLIAMSSIWAIDAGNYWVSIAWIVYQCYIIFDHIPFLCTNDLYTSARFNYEHTSLQLFWGMEAMDSVVSALSVVGAPAIVWMNLPNHFFFIVSNYFKQIATSKAFTWERKAVSWWLIPAVAMDTCIHAINMRCHLMNLLEERWMVATVWWTLMVSMTVLTVWFHREFIAWEHFMLYLGWRPRRFGRTAVAGRKTE